MATELESYQEFSQTVGVEEVKEVIYWIATEAVRNFSTRHGDTLTEISLDQLAQGGIPRAISLEEAAAAKRANVKDWYILGMNRMVIATILMVDQLALAQTDDNKVALLATKDLVLFNTQEGGGVRRIIKGLTDEQISQAEPLAIKVYEGIPEKDKVEYPPLQRSEDVIEHAAPLLAAASYVHSHGGPKFTPEKKEIMKIYAKKRRAHLELLEKNRSFYKTSADH